MKWTIDTARIEAFIPADTVDTGVSERDTHLRSPDFLDAAKYPELMFRAAAIAVIDGLGGRRARASATGTFSRREWGLAWDRILRFGGLLVADEVYFSLNIEAVADASTPVLRSTSP